MSYILTLMSIKKIDWNEIGLLHGIPDDQKNKLSNYFDEIITLLKLGEYDDHFDSISGDLFALVRRIFERTKFYDELNISDIMKKYLDFYKSHLQDINEKLINLQENTIEYETLNNEFKSLFAKFSDEYQL